MDFMSRVELTKRLKTAAVFGLTLSTVLIGMPAKAQEQQKTESATANRRIAMVLPKAPASQAGKSHIPVAVKVNGQAITRLDPEAEFASRPAFNRPAQKQMDEQLRTAIIDGASKAERLSRSYNHHVANLIVWLASSLGDCTTITPNGYPGIRSNRPLEPKPVYSQPNQIFQID